MLPSGGERESCKHPGFSIKRFSYQPLKLRIWSSNLNLTAIGSSRGGSAERNPAHHSAGVEDLAWLQLRLRLRLRGRPAAAAATQPLARLSLWPGNLHVPRGRRQKEVGGDALGDAAAGDTQNTSAQTHKRGNTKREPQCNLGTLGFQNV